MKKTYILLSLFLLAACAGPNPNPGERTVDIAWERYEYEKVFEILKPAAERGEPWAQLRMGVAYELGSGVKKDIPAAIRWYQLAASQEADDDWANGKLAGATGKPGYFNQTSDALIAKFQLSGIYLRGEDTKANPEKALELIQHVSDKTQGNSLFYCCESSGGRYITSTQIAQRLNQAREASASRIP